MNALKTSVRNFLADDAGTETLEWGLVAGLIIVGSITIMALIGPKIQAYWTTVNAALP